MQKKNGIEEMEFELLTIEEMESVQGGEVNFCIEKIKQFVLGLFSGNEVL